MIRKILKNKYCLKCLNTSNQKLISVQYINPCDERYYAKYQCDNCNNIINYDICYKDNMSLNEICNQKEYCDDFLYKKSRIYF